MENFPVQNNEKPLPRNEEWQPIKVTADDKGVRIEAVAGGGPGGQNVNKRATKAVVYFNISESDALSAEQKRHILCKGCTPLANDSLRRLWNMLNAAGTVVISNQEDRTQQKNVVNALNILNDLLNSALKPQTKRVDKPTKKAASKIRRDIQKARTAKYKEKKQEKY